MNVWQKCLIDADAALICTSFEDHGQLLVPFLHKHRLLQIRERFIRKSIRRPHPQTAQTKSQSMIMVKISVSLIHALLNTVRVDICHQESGNLFWLIL